MASIKICVDIKGKKNWKCDYMYNIVAHKSRMHLKMKELYNFNDWSLSCA
jgi:hypothetical protein